MMKRHHLICYGFILFSLQSVLALRCYKCSSAIGGLCDQQNLMSSQLVTCRPSGPTQENFCSKVTTSGTGQTTTIMRTCSVAGVNNCMERNGVNECTTACASDGCNIAYITRPALLATLIWICLTYLLTNLLVLTN